MSKFHVSVLLFILAVSLLIGWKAPDYTFLILLVSFGVFLVWTLMMSMIIKANYFLKAQNTLKNDAVLLTFDDGPHPTNTPKVLDVLKQSGVKAMFFLIGKNVEKYPEIVRRIVDEGHEIGGHTYHHEISFGFKTGQRLEEDISKAQQSLSGITGRNEIYFRPPFGVTNPNIAAMVKKLKLKMIGWSVRSFDTRTELSTERVKKIVKKIKSGSIVLLHERMDQTCAALPLLIEQVRQKGMDFGTMSEDQSSLS